MTRIKHVLLILAAIIYILPAMAQVSGKGEIVKQERQVGQFDAIDIGGGQEVVLLQGDDYSVVIETNANLLDQIDVVLKNTTLSFEYNKIKRYDELKFYITAPDFKMIKASGASEVMSPETLKGADLEIVANGASEIKLKLDYNKVITKATGASEVKLSGKATSHVVDASGASEVKAKEFETQSTVANASGASEIFVNTSSNLTYDISGASEVKYLNTPESLTVKSNTREKSVVMINDTIRKAEVYTYSDTTTVKVGGLNVEVIDSDTTKVTVGRHMIIIDDDGNVKYEKCKKPRFNGHWGGVELGINGYVTPDFNTNWEKKNDYLNLQYEKSMAVNLNLYEQNIALNKAKNMGLVTGIGMAWVNYRFSSSTYLTSDNSQINGYYMVDQNGNDLSLDKTKLTVMYITVPFMYEIQTKNTNRYKRFHFGIGVLGSARVRTHTKVYFNNANEIYYLQDPGTGIVGESSFNTPNASQRNIVKDYDSFHLQPFKFEGMVRIGFSVINLWAHVGLNQLFIKERGPELYTWSAGITIAGW
ncbi:MAG: DUF2807 domain-containing protein [Bacteroidetes bacterium]|nr:DUF2807 domain-containing protein [Bacteroidota bacterium]